MAGLRRAGFPDGTRSRRGSVAALLRVIRLRLRSPVDRAHRPPAFRPFFQYNHVFHRGHLLFEAGSLEHVVCSAWRHVDARFAGDRHRARFGRMLELAMAASHPNLFPAVG